MKAPDFKPVTSEVAGPSTVLCFQVLPSLLRPPSHPAAWLPKSSFRENSLSQIPTPGTQVGACSFLDARAMAYSPNGWAFGWADSASPIGGRRQSQLSRASKPLRDCGWCLTAWSTHRRSMPMDSYRPSQCRMASAPTCSQIRAVPAINATALLAISRVRLTTREVSPFDLGAQRFRSELSAYSQGRMERLLVGLRLTRLRARWPQSLVRPILFRLRERNTFGDE